MSVAQDIDLEDEPEERSASALTARVLPYGLSIVIFGLCVAPFLLVLAISFGRKIDGAAWVWDFTFENYQRFFVGIGWPDEVTLLYLQQLGFSFWYAVIASVLAILTAFPFTLALSRVSRRAQAIWLVFLLSSLSLSEVFIVMGWDILLSANSGLPALLRNLGVTAWAQETGWFQVARDWGLASPRNFRFKTSQFATIMTMSYLVWPYAVILLYPALSRLDPALPEAARTMGAGPWTVLRTVIIPSVRLPLLGSTLLLFVFLLGAYVSVTVFSAPANQTTAVAIYGNIRGGNLNAPFGSAQAIILLLSAGLCLASGHALNRASAR